MSDITTERARKTRGKQIRRGISWNAANLVINKGMSIFVRLLLARLLVPEHFGMIAMVVVFLGLVKIFVDFGLKNALIQRDRDAESLTRYDSAFWFLLGGGVGWTAMFVLAGIPLMIWFYDEPQLTELALIMSVSIPLHSLSILPEVRLTRRMRFKLIVMAEVVSTIVASLIAIALAFGGAGVWALASQQIVSVGIRTAMLWLSCRWRPRRRFAWQTLRDVVNYSGWMLGAQVVYYARTNMDNLAIGIILGATPLGIYTVAYMITETLRAQVSRVVSNVMLPVYSRMQQDLLEVKPHYLAVTRAMTLILFPFLLMVLKFSHELIGHLLDDVWLPAAQPARILALCGMVYAIAGPSAEVLQGIGRAKTLFRITFLNLLLIGVPSIVILTLKFGLVGSASAMLISYISVRLASHFALKKSLDLQELELFKAIAPAVFLAIALYGISTFFSINWIVFGLINFSAYLTLWAALKEWRML
ncbi:MAG: lipopolysaccharide biosynthesis protein [Actinobacteria bacterium]|nr:lipopolysaccharide biosynthesis protein [Actinomycetota bacterium]